ncbi:MAG TPA: hypothetical protein VGL81_07880 [Polyangiaceae bacterium]
MRRLVRLAGLAGLIAAAACSKEAPRPTEAAVDAAAPVALGPSATPSAAPGAAPSVEPGPTASASATPATSGSTAAHVAATPGTSTRLLDAGQAPRRALRYTWHVDQKEQLTMDLRTAASTEFAGAKQPEVPLPPVHIVLDLDPRTVTPSGDLRFAWRVSAATVTADMLTPSQIADGMRAEVSAIEHLAGTAAVTARGLSGGVTVDEATTIDAGVTGQMAEQIRQTLRDIAVPLPEEEVGRGARWQRTSQLDTKGSRLTQTDTFTLTELGATGGAVDDVLAQTAPPQPLRAPGMAAGTEARMESMLASGDGKTHFDLSRLVPRTSFTGTTTMVLSGPLAKESTRRITMIMRVGIDITGAPR